MKKKKKTVRKTKKKNMPTLSRSAKIIIAAAAVFMFACTFSMFYVVLGSYDGLGLPRFVKEHDYQMSSISKHKGRLSYEDENYETVAGIDVSYYQKEIDWKKVKKDGFDFAMIRLGYRGYEHGNLELDSRFKENLSGAKKADIHVGVYFFSQAVTVEEAVEEAKYVIRHIRGRGVTYPVVFDMEPISGAHRIDDLTVLDKTEIADAFCQIIERNGYTPMIYGNPTWLSENLDLRYLTRYDIWLAHYTDETDYPGEFKFWQYTDSGKVKGIKGKVDLNLMFRKK
ncbi:glycoside hydrolase family 25 protein [Anaerovoracaceae bacterium 42-11]|nr:glycoside hydrolase family 25 protein [Emergencia sp.]